MTQTEQSAQHVGQPAAQRLVNLLSGDALDLAGGLPAQAPRLEGVDVDILVDRILVSLVYVPLMIVALMYFSLLVAGYLYGDWL